MADPTTDSNAAASVRIKVIGVGGAGGNAVDHMIERGVHGVGFVCANTDAQALGRSRADTQVPLGHTGLGAGGHPWRGREAAEASHDALRAALAGTELLFIAAGLGGGTGTGAAPVVARLARELGALVVAVVTMPFEFEGRRRARQADEGLAELEAVADNVIVVRNERLLEVLGDEVTQAQAFARADDVLLEAVAGIAGIIGLPGLVNVDFEDLRTVMTLPGRAVMGSGRASGPGRARRAAEAALGSPLLDGVGAGGVSGVLVLISATRQSLRLAESRDAMAALRPRLAPDATVIYGAAYDEALGDALRVTLVATGIGRGGEAADRRPVPALPAHVVRQPVLPPSPPDTPATPATRSPGGDYRSLDTPSVWRSGRGASGDRPPTDGMDGIEIPAFLRRQVDGDGDPPAPPAGPRGPDGPPRDDVRLGAAAPGALVRGQSAVAHFVAYPAGQESDVRAQLLAQSPGVRPVLGKRTCRWAAGTEVRVRAQAAGLDVLPAEQVFTWSGAVESLDFLLHAPPQAAEGEVPIVFTTWVAGLCVATLALTVRVGTQPASVPPARAEATAGRTAFASYASPDRPLVLHMVGAIERSAGMEVFLDCLDLKASEAWKPRLETEIAARDLFLLFWSQHSRASRWVTWEWTQALAAKGEAAIQVHPLEADVPAPEPLAHRQFTDLYARLAAASTAAGATGPAGPRRH